MQYRFTRSWMYFHEPSTTSDRAKRAEEGGEQEEQERQAVEPDVVAEAAGGRPIRLLLERVAARPGAEAGQERDRDQEREQAEEEGNALVLPALAARH